MGGMRARNPILDLPLSAVMRSEIALPLQHVLRLYTVGSLLHAWRNPKNHRSIEQVFDSPQQARHAVAVCAAWLGVQTLATPHPRPARGVRDERVGAALAATRPPRRGAAGARRGAWRGHPTLAPPSPGPPWWGGDERVAVAM